MAGRSAIAIEGFADLIKSFKLLLDQKDAFEVASHIAKASGLLKELYDDKTVEGLARYENVQELLNAIKEFVDNPDNEEKSLSAFLQSVSLLTTADEKEDDGDNDKVTLMTIHAAKGLEFKNVHIVGLEEDLFPSQMMLESRNDLEEERRSVLRSHYPRRKTPDHVVCRNPLPLRSAEDVRTKPVFDGNGPAIPEDVETAVGPQPDGF